MTWRGLARALTVTVAMTAAVPAGADEPRDPLAAEALFDEARVLMKGGKFDEACPKLEASQRLDPGVGTLLNLADCYERSGKLASAWVRFREAASAALSAGQAEREKIARGRAAALEGRLARVTIRAPDATGDERIARDGIALERATWGTAVPVDPGEHVIEASAPGKMTWTARVTIPSAPEVTTVDVPALDDAPAPPPVAAAPAASTPAPPPPLPSPTMTVPETPPSRAGLGPPRIAAIGAAGLGVVGLALAGGFALSARATYADAQGHCTSAGCDPDGVRLGHDAGRAADVATVSFAVGGVALVAAAILWLTAPAK